MTPRKIFLTYSEGDSIAEKWQQAKELKVDTLPIAKNGDIEEFYHGSVDEIRTIAEYSLPHHTSMAQLIEHFNTSQGKQIPVVFVAYADTIIGLVTPSDLNKMPARSYFYMLISELEMRLAKLVRNHFQNDQSPILNAINNEERKKWLEEQRNDDLGIDFVHSLYLYELLAIIKHEDSLLKSLGFTKSQLDKYNGIDKFRNDIMHSVRRILDDYSGIERLNDYSQKFQTLLAKIPQI